MTRPMTLRRSLAPLLCLLTLGACDAVADGLSRVRGVEQSPFLLFEREDLRTGMRFARLQAIAKEEMTPPAHLVNWLPPNHPKPYYDCRNLWAGARRCTLQIDPGTLVAIVDERGYAIRLTVVTRDSMPLGSGASSRGTYEQQLGIMRDGWNKVGVERAASVEGLRAAYRHSDPRGKYSAAAWYSSRGLRAPPEHFRFLRDSLATIPDSIAVTHDSAYIALMKRQPKSDDIAATTELVTPGAPAGTTPKGPAAPTGRSAQQAMAVLTRDLEMMPFLQEQYLAKHGRYAGSVSDLEYAFLDSMIVEVQRSANGWSASATWVTYPETNCVIFVGSPTRVPRTRRDGLGAPAGYAACDAM